jgi:SAM-dependent methyltransferase
MRPFRVLWEYACDGSVISIATTPNCSTVCATTVGRSVYLLDGSGRPIWDVPFSIDAEGWAIAISEDSRFIAVGTANKTPADGTLYVITRDGKLFWSQRIRAPIWSVSLSADGERLAASTWKSNQLHLFRRQGSGYVAHGLVTVPGESGLYGATLTQNGQLCIVASYDSGLYVFEANGALAAHAEYSSGLYNVALAPGGNTAFAGTRDGTFAVAALDEATQFRFSPLLSQRPVCGIAVTENGLLVACGSFDGRVILANDRGGTLWDFQTKGEVWTTAISTNGALVCAAGGDMTVRMFSNYCDTAAYQEILALEDALGSSSGSAALSSLEILIDLYLKYQLADYGYSRLTQLLKDNSEAHLFRDKLRTFLESATVQARDAVSSLHLGELLLEEKRYKDAVKHFQEAARTPALRSSAQRRAAECFTELDLPTAATSAWRQSREQHLDDDARQVLFLLARSYEDAGEWREASRIYEMLLSWDAAFRNSWAKLALAQKFRASGAMGTELVDKDYTGSTVSLLGPDARRDVDPSLAAVIKARSRETLLQPGDRDAVRAAVGYLLKNDTFSRGLRRDSSHLGYDIQLFLKYEFGLPEDEMKKFLETVNALPHFEEQLARNRPCTSLDIGSATGRYPRLLTDIGFRAYGIDIAEDAINYSTKQSEGPWPLYVRGDATELDKHLPLDLRFNVVTCMMGTFEHIPRDEQPALLRTMHNRLATSGVAIISVWDVECPHLAYLSIYDEVQKEMIRKNSRTRADMRRLLSASGFVDPVITPFSLLPQSAIYDLGIQRMEAADIEVAAQADLAARASFTERHGEMFLAIGHRR